MQTWTVRMPLIAAKHTKVYPKPGEVKLQGNIDDVHWGEIRRYGVSAVERALVWDLLLTHEVKQCKRSKSFRRLLDAALDTDVATVIYMEKGGTEAWAQTVNRVSMDVARTTYEPGMLQGTESASNLERLHRMLLAYALHDPEVGYCQGMTDLALPFLHVFDSDDEAYAAFAALMARIRPSFLPGMHELQQQLALLGMVLHHTDPSLHKHLVRIGAGDYVFAFQMMLLQLRREVAWPDVFTLWECMWASERLLATAHHSQRLGRRRWGNRRSGLNPVRGAPSSMQGTAKQAEESGQLKSLTGSTGSPLDEELLPPCHSHEGLDSGQKEASRQGTAEISSVRGRTDGSQEPPLAAGRHVAGNASGADSLVSTSAANAADPDAVNSPAAVDLRVYVVAAALRSQRAALLGCTSPEEVVQFVNRMPRLRNVIRLVHDAERMYLAYRRKVMRGSTGTCNDSNTDRSAASTPRCWTGCLQPLTCGEDETAVASPAAS